MSLSRFLLVFLTFLTFVFSQNQTSLFSIIMSNSELNRDKTFEDLHEQLNLKVKETKPGLQMKYLTVELRKLTKKIETYVTNTIEEKLSNDDGIINDIKKFIDENRNSNNIDEYKKEIEKLLNSLKSIDISDVLKKEQAILSGIVTQIDLYQTSLKKMENIIKDVTQLKKISIFNDFYPHFTRIFKKLEKIIEKKDSFSKNEKENIINYEKIVNQINEKYTTIQFIEKYGNRDQLLIVLQTDLIIKLNSLLRENFYKVTSTNNVKIIEAISDLALYFINNNDYTNYFLETTTISSIDKLSQILSYIMITGIFDHFGIEDQPVIFELDKIQKSFSDILSKKEKFKKIISSILKQFFEKIELKIKEKLKQVNDALVKANVGFGASKGEGRFEGGMHYTSKLGDKTNLGVYMNGSFAAGDSSNVENSLIGIQFRYNTNQSQFDILLSGYFGDPNYSNFEQGEFGLAYSWKSSHFLNSYGFAFFTRFFEHKGPGYTAGFMMKRAESNSMGLILGAMKSEDSNTWQPIVKITQPLGL